MSRKKWLEPCTTGIYKKFMLVFFCLFAEYIGETFELFHLEIYSGWTLSMLWVYASERCSAGPILWSIISIKKELITPNHSGFVWCGLFWPRKHFPFTLFCHISRWMSTIRMVFFGIRHEPCDTVWSTKLELYFLLRPQEENKKKTSKRWLSNLKKSRQVTARSSNNVCCSK